MKLLCGRMYVYIYVKYICLLCMTIYLPMTSLKTRKQAARSASPGLPFYCGDGSPWIQLHGMAVGPASRRKKRSKEKCRCKGPPISLADKDYLPLSSTGKVDPSASVRGLVADWLAMEP